MEPRSSFVGIEEVGQTTAPTLGPNFVKAMFKGQYLASVRGGAVRMLEGLRKLGFHEVVAELKPLAKATSHDADMEVKEDLWRAMARFYTLQTTDDVGEDGLRRSLYRELNSAIRMDSETLSEWAGYIGFLIAAGGANWPACVTRLYQALAPEDVRPRRKQRVYRGFTVDESELESVLNAYAEGRHFFWQAFSSTSLREEISSESFAGESAGKASLVCHIDLPAYDDEGFHRFYVYDLQSVSHFSSEAEMLLLPYTRFRVVSEPTVDPNGVHQVHLRAQDFPFPFNCRSSRIVVWLDTNGFTSGSNAELAKETFLHSFPSFQICKPSGDVAVSRRQADEVPGRVDGMGLFTEAAAALDWMKTLVAQDANIVFRIVVSGRASQELLNAYFAEATSCPCEVLVFCNDVSKWSRYWQHCGNIQVTRELADVRSFLQNRVYDPKSDDFGIASVPRRGTLVWYPWREVSGGVIYGGMRSTDKLPADKWSKCSGAYPDIAMRPFENKGERALEPSDPASRGRCRRLKQRFAKFDVNGDGSLSLGEMAALLRKGNPRMSDAGLRILFRQCDVDDSGRIEFDEFVDYIHSQKTTRTSRGDSEHLPAAAAATDWPPKKPAGISVDVLIGFIIALRQEYVHRLGPRVGEFFEDTFGDSKRGRVAERKLDPIEEKVRKMKMRLRASAIDDLEQAWTH